MSEKYGLLIDYEYCTGCESCVVSCKEEHDYPVGKWGIRVFDDGPWNIEGDMFNFNRIPVPTDLCDLCADRTEAGREPICVHHCLANCITYGPVKELAEKLTNKRKQVLWVPEYKPLTTKGKFVSNNEKKHTYTQMNVKAVSQFETATHRSETRSDVELLGVKKVEDE